MLWGCGNEGETGDITTLYNFTANESLNLLHLTVYSKGGKQRHTYRFMNPSKERVEGRMRTEDPLSTKWAFQGQTSSGCNACYKGRSPYELLLWLFISVFWQNTLPSHSDGPVHLVLRGFWSLVKRLQVSSFQKWPCYLWFSKFFFSVCFY